MPEGSSTLKKYHREILQRRRVFRCGDERRCRVDDGTTAFTVPGSRVVHVCVNRFAGRFAVKTREGEPLTLNELLHTLGLMENPPSSAAISVVVRKRCGL